MSKLFRHDEKANAMYIYCNNVEYIKSIEISPSIILDFGIDKQNNIKVKGIECGSIHDRDENAAINILNQGLKDLGLVS